MSYKRFKHSLAYCLGVMTEDFVLERYISYKHGFFRKDYPELSEYYWLLNF